MKLFVSILSILTASESSSTITTYNLTESGGLRVRRPHHDGTIVDFHLAPLMSGEPYCYGMSNGEGYLPIGPGSSYAAQVHSVLLMPPSELYPNFRLIESLRDPTPYCFEGAIGFAEMRRDWPEASQRRGVQFTASVALIPRQNISEIAEVSEPVQYELDFISHHDHISYEIFHRLASEVQRLGIFSADNVNIALLPSLEYTIYRSLHLSDAIVKIRLEPEDYLDFSLTNGILRLRPSHMLTHPRIGLNTLKRIGLFLNYESNEIGFCEPI